MTIIFPSDRHIHADFYELQRYLGAQFQLSWCDGGDEKGEEDANSDKYKDNDDFIRNTLVFAYQNIGLSTVGIHRPYIAKLLELTDNRGPLTVLDFGAGGGQVGLALHALGFKVSFADIYSQSFNWLMWRLHERRLNLPVYCIDWNEVKIPKHDIVVCFDVMEHCKPDEQLKILHQCADYGRNVFMNLIADNDHNKLHFPVDIEALSKYVGNNWPSWAKDFYGGKQRLLVYGEGVRTSQGILSQTPK